MEKSNSGLEKYREESRSGLAMRKMRLGFLQHFDWGAIEKLKNTVMSYLQDSPEERMKQYPEDWHPELLQTLYEEEQVYGEELAGLVDELCIVALYKKVEIDTKKALKIAFPLRSQKDFFNWQKLKQFLLQGIDIEGFPSYSGVNELRCINNCVKHGGMVDGELGRLPGWTEGDRLENLGKHFHRLGTAAEQYLRALTEALYPKLR